MSKKNIAIIVAIVLLPIILSGILNNSNSPFSKKKSSLDFSAAGKKLGLLKIRDVIFSSESTVKLIEDFQKDNSIAGVLLRIDSPGGAVAPSQEIFRAVEALSESGKPVVVSMGNVAASGGYYIAAPADMIFANPGTITGSIGVIMQFPHYHGLLDKLGVQMTTIKAGKLKDIGNPNRDLTTDEKKFLQTFIDNTHSQFINHVASSRNMDPKRVRELADGRIYTGEQALNVELVDSLGTFSDAMGYLRKITGVSDKVKPVTKYRNAEFFKDLLSETIFEKFPFLKSAPKPAGCYYLLENF